MVSRMHVTCYDGSGSRPQELGPVSIPVYDGQVHFGDVYAVLRTLLHLTGDQEMKVIIGGYRLPTTGSLPEPEFSARKHLSVFFKKRDIDAAIAAVRAQLELLRSSVDELERTHLATKRAQGAAGDAEAGGRRYTLSKRRSSRRGVRSVRK
jgi:hypothetical protein